MQQSTLPLQPLPSSGCRKSRSSGGWRDSETLEKVFETRER